MCKKKEVELIRLLFGMFQVDYSKNVGRFLKSTQSIDSGVQILQEDPLAIGPKSISKLLCLGCHKSIQTTPVYRCVVCNWPVCNLECQRSRYHGTECILLAKSKFQANIVDDFQKKQSCYAIIVPLRCLVLKKFNRKQFDQLMQLESHYDKRISTPYYKLLEHNVVPFLQVTLQVYSH